MSTRTEETLRFEGESVLAVSPEGKTSSIPIASLMDRVVDPISSLTRLVLPVGCRAAVSLPQGFAVVWEGAPRVWPFRWIARNSPRPFGPGTAYREVRLALPFVVVIAIFLPTRNGTAALSDANECFFRNERLRSLDDELRYPALLNCSRFADEADHPLSWICTQHLDRSTFAGDGQDLNAVVETSLRGLVTHLLESAFNLSSDVHEAASWFSETVRRRVDPRIASVEAWQEASREDPCFAVDVDWLPTGRTVRGVLDRIGARQPPSPTRIRSRKDLARFVVNHGKNGGPP
jgi:hypothetical protein